MKTLLLAEDRPEDVFIMMRALQRAKFACHLQVAPDGSKIIDYLSGEGRYIDRKIFPIPDLILLDIKMPRRTGHEVLEWIRSRPEFNQLPVVMLTGSNEPSDLERAYSAGANSYLVKPVLYLEFERMLPCLLEYWLHLNQTQLHSRASTGLGQAARPVKSSRRSRLPLATNAAAAMPPS
jgi:CheY-like chemotaxis protein